MHKDGQGPINVFVVGTRAQLIKVAPVMVACERAGQPGLLLLTGQHKETMQDLVAEFGIRSPQESVVEVSERATVWSLLRWLPRVHFALVRRLRELRRESARVNVIVHGDTLSSVIGALAARQAGATVFHLESGLSSGRLFNPFPEELSRRIVFRLTDVALCPGPEASDYMRRHHRCEVLDTGQNTIVDSVMMATSNPAAATRLPEPGPYMVASLHRFQNIFKRERLRFLVELLGSLSARYPVYFVLHPATRKRLEKEGLMEVLANHPGLRPMPRLGYTQFLALAAGAAAVLTDGGSNQEELAVLGVPTLVMREATERPDGLGANAVMEGDLRLDVLGYCLSGSFEQLRRPSRVGAAMGPSIVVANRLAA